MSLRKVARSSFVDVNSLNLGVSLFPQLLDQVFRLFDPVSVMLQYASLPDIRAFPAHGRAALQCAILLRSQVRKAGFSIGQGLKRLLKVSIVVYISCRLNSVVTAANRSSLSLHALGFLIQARDEVVAALEGQAILGVSRFVNGRGIVSPNTSCSGEGKPDGARQHPHDRRQCGRSGR